MAVGEVEEKVLFEGDVNICGSENIKMWFYFNNDDFSLVPSNEDCDGNADKSSQCCHFMHPDYE